MALTTTLRVLIEGDAGGLISQLTKAGRESRNVFSEVSRSAKAEFAKASQEADKAFKEIAKLEASARRADKVGNTPLAGAYRSQAAAKQAEYDKMSAIAVAAEKRIQAESAKTVLSHAAEATAVSRLGAEYAHSGGGASRFFGSITKEGGAAAKTTGALKNTVSSLVTAGPTAAISTLGSEMKTLGKAAVTAEGGVAAVSGGLGAAGGAALGAAAALAVGAAGFGILAKTTASGIEAFQKYAGEVRRVQNIMGGTAHEASLVSGQFRHFGVDVDAGSKAMGIFASNAVNNGGKKLTDLGITIARTKDGQVDLNKTLLNAGDAFKSYGAGAEGATLARGAFGRGGLAIIPVLKAEREELEAVNRATSDQGLDFNKQDLKDAKDLTIATRELHHSFEGLQVVSAKGLAPLFTGTAEGATDLLNQLNEVTQKVGGIGGVIRHSVGGIGNALGALGGAPVLGSAIDSLSKFGAQSSQAAKDQAILQQALDDSGEQTSGFVAKMLKAGYTLEQVNQKVQLSGKSMEELEAGASIAPVFDSLGHAMTRMANDAKFAGEESSTLKAKLDQLGAGAISLASTETNVAAAQDALGKALKDNGADFDNHTEKGRANRQAMEQDASAILANVNALSSQGASVGEVSAAWDNQVGALKRTLQAAGLTDTQINGLLRDYGLIPATKETLVNANTAEAAKRLAALIEQLNHLQRTDFSVNVSGGIAAGAIHFGGSGSTARLSGGPVKQRREYEVTERGPELFIAQQKVPHRVSKLAQLKHKADESAQETLVRLGVPGGIEPKATRKGAPALLLGGGGPQMFRPPADGVIVNATDTKRLQRTEDEDVITRILKRAGADRRTLEAMTNATAPHRAAGGRVEHGETYKVSERGNESFFPKFEFNAPKKASPTVGGPGIKRGSDGSYTISVGDTHLTVQGETAGSAKGVNKRDVDRIVERKQAELVAELVAAMRSG